MPRSTHSNAFRSSSSQSSGTVKSLRKGSHASSSQDSNTVKPSRQIRNAESVKKYRRKKQQEQKKIEEEISSNELRITYLEEVVGYLCHELEDRPGKNKSQNRRSGTSYEIRPKWFGVSF